MTNLTLGIISLLLAAAGYWRSLPVTAPSVLPVSITSPGCCVFGTFIVNAIPDALTMQSTANGTGR